MIKIEGFGKVLDEIQKERNVDKQVLKDAIAAAILSASKKKLPLNDFLEAKLEDDGTFMILAKKTVVMKVTDPNTQIAKKDAAKMQKTIKTGDEVLEDVTPSDFGRLAAQTAKQVIIQRIREAEKEGAYEEYIKKQGEIVGGIVQRKEMNGYLVNLGKVEALLPFSESIPGDNYRPKDRIKIIIVETKKTPKGPYIAISRTNPNFLKKLFDLEIPEVNQGIIEVKAIAREPGRRSKVAVFSHDKNVGAVGTCIGHMGARIQNIVKELNNERIDVIEWSDNQKVFITNALAPARASRIDIVPNENAVHVIVPEAQLSLAIGKEGQNVRLAAKLTGMKIDIISEESEKKVAEVHPEEVKPEEVKAEEVKAEEVKTEEVKTEAPATVENTPSVETPKVKAPKKGSKKVVELSTEGSREDSEKKEVI
jgi:transcription termination/antitermination protein NusA